MGVIDSGRGRRARQAFAEDLKHCERVTLETWERALALAQVRGPGVVPAQRAALEGGRGAMIEIPIWVLVAMGVVIAVLGLMLWTNLRERNFNVKVPGHRQLRGGPAFDRRHDAGDHPGRQQGGALLQRRRVLPGAPRSTSRTPRRPSITRPTSGGRATSAARWRRRSRPAPGKASRCGSCSTPPGRSRWTRSSCELMKDAGCQGGPLPSDPPDRPRPAQQAHPPQARRSSTAGSAFVFGHGISHQWTGQRAGQGPLARHRRAPAGAGRQRRAVGLRPALDGGDGRGAGGGEVLPAPGARGRDCGCTSWPARRWAASRTWS